jgi:hypothetical protein
MSTERGDPLHVPEPQLSVLGSDQTGLPLAGEPAPEPESGRVEAQLQGRIAQLEAAVTDLGRCLEDAEQRAAELEATRARAAALEEKLAVVVTSRSWRLTTPLRRAVQRARRSVRS